MRIAVISDVHGNFQALKAVLADIDRQAPDLTVNLGDMLSGPLEPARCADLLMEKDIPGVRGNHDRALVGTPGRIDAFAAAQLSSHHFAWLADLPPTRVVAGEVFLCHGTPQDDRTPWLDNWWDDQRSTVLPDHIAVAAQAEAIDYPVLLCGHTHIPRVMRLNDGRLLVNPGAVGLQMTLGAPDARYALIERIGSRWATSLRTVPYDHETAGQIALNNGYPRWQAALTSGWLGNQGLF